MILLLVISQLYFYYFIQVVLDSITIDKLHHKILIWLSLGINFTLICLSLFFIYNL